MPITIAFFRPLFYSRNDRKRPTRTSVRRHHSRYWLLPKENKTCSIMPSCREKEPEPFLLIHPLSHLPHALPVLPSSKWLSLSPTHAACPSLRFHYQLIRYVAAQCTVLPGTLWSRSDWAVTFSSRDPVAQLWKIKNKQVNNGPFTLKKKKKTCFITASLKG